MELTPAKFLGLFLVLSGTGWLLFTFTARLLAWMLGRMVGAVVRFRIGGLNCLKDISMNFKKGSMESLVIGELRVRLCRPFTGLHNRMASRVPKLHVLLYDAEVVLRKNAKQTSTRASQHKKHPSGRGKWMILANIAKYLTVTVMELVVQIPTWTVEVKELDLSMDSEETGLSLLGVRLMLMACNIYEREQRVAFENSCSLSLRERLLSVGGLGSRVDGTPAPFSIEHLSINSTFGHEREQGVTIRHIDVTCGEVSMDLSEELLRGKSHLPGTTVVAGNLEVGHDSCTRANRVGLVAEKHEGKSVSSFLNKIPEKASFNLPKLVMKCCHKEKGVVVENEITGIQLSGTKIHNLEGTGDTISRLDIHMDCGEIQILREADKSLLEIMKVAVAASLEIPRQPNGLLQAEVDVKLGGAQCNLLTNKFEQWIYLLDSIKLKEKDTSLVSERKSPAKKNAICWTCTLSAPEMAIVVYNLDGVAIYNACSQTSHLFINSISNLGVAVHTELGELHVYLVEEEHERFKESLFGVDTNPGCLLQMSRVTVDWGVTDLESTENETDKRKMALVIEVSGSALYLTLQRLQTLVSSSMAFAVYFKSLLVTGHSHRARKGNTTKHKGSKRGVRVLKLCLEGLSVQLCEQLHVVDADVPDPKKVNFGSQGGEVVLTENDDGKPRKASIRAAVFDGVEGAGLKCKATAEISHLYLHIDRDKGDTQVDLQRVKTSYQELGSEVKLISEIILASLQSGKIVYQTAMVGKGIPGCLICATDLRGRWEPDVQLFFHGIFLRMKTFVQKQKEKMRHPETAAKSPMQLNQEQNMSESSKNSKDLHKSDKNRSQAIAVDIEQVDFSAALADGVEGSLSIKSVFSEDVRIGVLLEELKAALNNATVLRSKCLQVARLPSFLQDNNGKNAVREPTKAESSAASCWDYLIQGSGIRVTMPYRLQCRAIEDAIEDMWRGLKLVMVAQKSTLSCTSNKINGKKPSKPSSGVGEIKFVLDSITAEIEEEPLQGWFDEHHQLIRQQVFELAVRERLLDEVIAEGARVCVSQCASPDLRDLHTSGLSSMVEGKDLDLSDPAVRKGLKEKLQQQAFQAYRNACQKLQPYDGSGSSRSALQSGFRASINRGFLMLIQATNLEVTLTEIQGGIPGMVEHIRKLDCVSPELEIPFSRILGKHVKITTSSLVIQLRNYTFPILSATGGKCDGQIIFARQATCFPKQVAQEVYIGRWRKLKMLRSQSGTTPSYKMYSELPIEFEKAEVAYGVGFEPAFADVSYAFSVALRKADLSVHDFVKDSRIATGFNILRPNTGIGTSNVAAQPVKKERSLPWWDDMRYYVHGRNSITASKFKWVFLATTDPYEKRDMMRIVASFMEIQQREGRLSFIAKEFDLIITSLERIMMNQGLKQVPMKLGQSCIHSPFFQLDITMDWNCESGNHLHHYLHALPNELVTREKVYDPFRSTSLALRWNFRLRASPETEDSTGPLGDLDRPSHKVKSQNARKVPTHKSSKDPASASPPLKTEDFDSVDTPTMNLGAHDLIWIFKWWGMYYSPPHKLRTFSKWPRFGLPRVLRSGNLSLDKVLTEFMLRVDATPARIKHAPLVRDDPAEGLTFNMKKLKYELCYSRGKQRYTFDSKRDILELVYQGLDLHMLKAELKRESSLQNIGEKSQASENVKHGAGLPGTVDEPSQDLRLLTKSKETGFFFTTDYFSLRKQAPKADILRLSSWQEGGSGPSSIDASCGEAEFAHGSGSDPTRSDPSDDDGFNIVLPDNCLHVSLYGLKLLWTIANRDAVWAWVEDISRAFESPKPSPSRQYAQRKIIEEQNKLAGVDVQLNETSKSGGSPQYNKGPSVPASPSRPEKAPSISSPSRKGASSPFVNPAPLREGWPDETEEEGTMHFMVNVVQPQFNLHSEDARGRFLLAAGSGKVIARSFHSIMHVRPEMIAQALRPGGEHLHGSMPEMTWNRRELSVLLEQVQAHVAPTDVDPGAGLQWLPKIPRGAPKVKRTGALLERVFMPCAMYFQYTRCKSGTADLKVKPLKELSFNSPNITATMTSRQFQIMVDVMSSLLFARLPKPRKNILLHYGDEDDSVEEEADEVVPDGVEEVELARVKLEQSEREVKLLSDDFRTVKQVCSAVGFSEEDLNDGRQEGKLWMLSSGKPALACRLGDDLGKKKKARKLAAVSLRNALRRAAQQRFTEKEKNKSPSFAMRISWAIDKVVWSMISDGEIFAEAEISNMILNVDHGYNDIGIAQLTTKYFVVKNCLPNAKSNTVLSAWNPPTEWGRNFMLRVDAKQGAPKDGRSSLELFQVEIYPLKIYLTEPMYRMMWDYFFPEEDQDSQRRQVWKASTTAVVKRGKRMASAPSERPSSVNNSKREETSTKTTSSASSSFPPGVHPHLSNREWPAIDFRLAAQILEKDVKKATAKNAAAVSHRRTSSFDRTWEDKLSGNIALDIVPNIYAQPSICSSRNTHYPHSGEAESVQQNSTASANTVENGAVKLRDSGRVNKLHKTSSQEDKKVSKAASQEEKKDSRLQHSYLEFQNIKISQVELLVTYEGSRLTVSELRLLMDTFTRLEFTGTWRRLFSRVKKHIIWGVLKSVTGMQGKKFKDKLQAQGQTEAGGYPGDESDSSDSGGSNAGIHEPFPIPKFKRQSDRAGEGFVSSIRGLFNSQRRKAKALVLRTMGVDSDEDIQGDWTESEVDSAPFTRQLSISKAKRLLRRHTKKFLSTRHRGGILFKDQSQASPKTSPFQSGASSDASSCYEDFND